MDPMQFARLLQQQRQTNQLGAQTGQLGLQAAGQMGGGLGAIGGPVAAIGPGLGAEAAAGELGSGGLSPTAKAGLISMLASSLGSTGRDRSIKSRVPMPQMPQLAQYRPY